MSQAKMEDIISLCKRRSFVIRVLMFTAVCLERGYGPWRSIEATTYEFMVANIC